MSDARGLGLSDEWYTPKYIFDAMGMKFDLDVAHPPQRTNVPAAKRYFDGGLERPWFGFVWMNPPFGGRNGVWPWLKKFVAYGNGVCLTADRTSAPWFRWAGNYMDAFLFISPKVKFERPDGTAPGSPSTGTVLMAIGTKGVAALHRAGAAGLGLLLVRPHP